MLNALLLGKSFRVLVVAAGRDLGRGWVRNYLEQHLQKGPAPSSVVIGFQLGSFGSCMSLLGQGAVHRCCPGHLLGVSLRDCVI